MDEASAEPTKRPSSQSQDTEAKSPKGSVDLPSEVRSSSSSAVSHTSTEEFHHVPFDQFSQQIKDLCQILWPPSDSQSRLERSFWGRNHIVGRFRAKSRALSVRQTASSSTDFQVDRLLGGSFNRVVGLTVFPEAASPTRLILRVPRFETAHHEREVAATRFVQQYTAVPVPEVKFVDFTANNPLNQRYVIQTRIPGFDLQCQNGPCWFPSLTIDQKCTVAKRLAEILIELHKVTHPFPGHIEASSMDQSNKTFSIRHFELRWKSDLEPEQDLNKKSPFFQPTTFKKDWKLEAAEKKPFEETTLYFMLAQFGRWKALDLRRDPVSIIWMNYYDRLATMAKQMDELGFLGNDDNCLCHQDLNPAPRNIMAEIEPNDSLNVTGILDWDSLIFAPRFVACVPPMWLWAWNDEEDEDEKKADDLPATPEQQKVKRVFEENIGNWFCQYAYAPQYRLARALFRYAHGGMSSSTDMDDVDKLVDEWNDLYNFHSSSSPNAAKDNESFQSATSNRERGSGQHEEAD